MPDIKITDCFDYEHTLKTELIENIESFDNFYEKVKVAVITVKLEKLGTNKFTTIKTYESESSLRSRIANLL